MQRATTKLRRSTRNLVRMFAAMAWLYSARSMCDEVLPAAGDSSNARPALELAAKAAATTTTGRYSLADLLDIALSNNPQVREVAQETRQGELRVQLAKSRYAPEINLQAIGGSQRTPLAIPPTVSPAGYFVSSTHELLPSLELKWLLFDFGRRDAQLQEAEHTALAAQSTQSRVQEKLVFDVSDAYFRAVSAQGRVHAARKALNAATLAEQAVDEQRAVGRATVVQVAEVKRRTAAMQLALTKAIGTARTSFVTLITTVGLPPQTQLDLQTPDPASLEQPIAPLQAVVDNSLRSRPDIMAAREKVAAAGANVELTRAAYRPTISVTAQVFQNIGSISSNGSPYSSINRTGYGVFVTLKWPLFDGGLRKTNVSLALSSKEAAEDALAASESAATREVARAYEAIETSVAASKQADIYAHVANVAYQASLDSYRHGLSSVTDLADDEAAVAQAEADLEDANATVRIAQAALALATGQPPSAR